MKSSLLFPLFLLFSTSLLAQLTVVTNQPQAVYQANEPMFFEVRSSSPGQATYEIRYDTRAAVIKSGTIQLAPGQVTRIPFTDSKPGFVVCKIEQSGQVAEAGAGFSIYDIDAPEEEPEDFDEFWDAQKAKLDAIPMDANVQLHTRSAQSTTYRVDLANIDDRRVYGYVTIPDGAGPFPAILTLPSAGNIPNISVPEVFMAELANVIAMSISIHNAAPDQADPNGYLPDDITDREGNYYKQAILGAIRSIDYLFSMPQFDGENLGVVGVSQGGGLSLMVSGIDQRVKLMVQSNAAMCNHAGLKYDEASAYPFYLFRNRLFDGSIQNLDKIVEASKYYDATYFARRYKGPSFHTIGYRDNVCPPATTLAAYNQMLGSKVLLHARELEHTHPGEYWNGRFDFFRRIFESTRTLPSGVVITSTGYLADAGPDNVSTSSNSIGLEGIVNLNDQPIVDAEIIWEKVSGPGDVTFSNPNKRNTTATFSESGTYILRLTGNDYAKLDNEAKYFTIVDHVTVTVGSGTGDVTPPEVTLATDELVVEGPFEVSVRFSEAIEGFELADVAVDNGTLAGLSGNGQAYTFTVTPESEGALTIEIPGGTLTDLAGNPSKASNVLTLTYKIPTVGDDKIDLSLNLEADRDAYKVFENIIYTLTIENNSTVDATEVVVDFPVVEGQAFVSVTTSSGSYAGWTGEWVLSSLPAGGSATMQLNLYGFADVIEATAFAQVLSVAEEDKDSSPGNNATKVPAEDDEAVVVLRSDNGSGGGGGVDQTPPRATLSTGADAVDDAFVVNISFTEGIDGLEIADFTVDNGTASDLVGNGQSFSLTITPATDGEVLVRLLADAVQDAAGNGNLVSNELRVRYTAPGGGGGSNGSYCQAEGRQPWNQWINRVQIAGIDNWSTKERYGDFSTQRAFMKVESEHYVRLTPAYGWRSYEEYWRVWIDLNQDGDFFDVGEEVFEGFGIGVVDGFLRIPEGVNLGETRMRVAMKNGSFPSPCETFEFGEVEDYSVVILNSGGNTGGGGPSDYCTSVGNASNDWISRVVFNTIDNASDQDEYGDYTAISTRVSIGQAIQLQLEPGKTNPSDDEYWRIWIDYNQDETFDQGTELVYSFFGKGNVYGTLFIQDYAQTGPTRMRIAMQRDGYLEDACENPSFGEVEEYTLIINPAATARGGAKTSQTNLLSDWQIAPNPARDFLNVQWSGLTTGAPVELEVVNTLGQLMRVQTFDAYQSNQLRLSLDGLTDGMYYLLVRRQGQKAVLKPFVVAR
ncbi:MAG: acetylxylan esterase [Bacteroidota bacterium]